MSLGFDESVVSVAMSSWMNDMRAFMVLAKNIHHGSCHSVDVYTCLFLEPCARGQMFPLSLPKAAWVPSKAHNGPHKSEYLKAHGA